MQTREENHTPKLLFTKYVAEILQSKEIEVWGVCLFPVANSDVY